MRVKTLVIVMAAMASGLACAADTSVAGCDQGPVKKIYGRNPWLVYSCSDGKSLKVVAAPGNRAAPFYFMVQDHKVTGEGGKKKITAAASAELSQLSDQDIAALIAETKSLPKE